MQVSTRIIKITWFFTFFNNFFQLQRENSEIRSNLSVIKLISQQLKLSYVFKECNTSVIAVL